VEPLCLGKPVDPGRSGKDNRLFVEAALRIVGAGGPWRDPLPSFGRIGRDEEVIRGYIRNQELEDARLKQFNLWRRRRAAAFRAARSKLGPHFRPHSRYKRLTL
jgi:hypothetical protein